MDQFQAELLETIKAFQSKQGQQSEIQDQYSSSPFNMNLDQKADSTQYKKPPGLENYSHEQLMEMAKQLQEGKLPEEIFQQQKYTDEKGNPIIDKEGGAMIQPNAGFVVKTKDLQSGNKVFVNMTHHEIVDPFEQKAIPIEDQEKYGSSDTGVRIPLSLGDLREDSDKKGEPVQVYDFIFNSQTIKNAQKNAGFRQAMVELSFNYVSQKFGRQLDLKFSIPKMKYKGATIQYQRVKVKKNPKIQEVQMTEEEKNRLAQRALEEERRKEAFREKEPKWNLYCILDDRFDKNFSSQQYIQSLIKDSFDNDCAGDDNDRWSNLQENFEIKQQYDLIEEYDGLNQDEASSLLITVTLPLLSRGHAIQLHVLKNFEYIQIHVPSLYHLALNLPFIVQKDSIKSYFDCKIKRLFIFAQKEKQQNTNINENAENIFEEVKVQFNQPIEEEEIIEIDTDVHFGRKNTGKNQKIADNKVQENEKNENIQDDDIDLLYDLC